MSQWDKEYITLCKKILSEGTEVANRTGINTVKIPAYHFSLNVGEEFPLLGRRILSALCRLRLFRVLGLFGVHSIFSVIFFSFRTILFSFRLVFKYRSAARILRRTVKRRINLFLLITRLKHFVRFGLTYLPSYH
ncbi:MAG: thymidylate synthase [Ruminococcaceae bacterium]|nr:thymidylate synthase [Oscillospiraceae bacterium]